MRNSGVTFHPSDLADLKKAKALLENPGLAAKITNLLGTPIEKGFAMLPEDWKIRIGNVTHGALTKAIRAALWTMADTPGAAASTARHQWAVAVTGAGGGFFGLPALAVELPISTAVMLRSIADIARSEFEPLNTAESRIACVEVFTLGGPTVGDNASESGYYAVRAALAQSVTNAAEYVTQKGVSEKGAPVMVRLIVQVAQRFSIQVSEKAVAQALPVIGAAGGAAINTIFINHFQDMARGHFIVRRLERQYGKAVVEEVYRKL